MSNKGPSGDRTVTLPIDPAFDPIPLASSPSHRSGLLQSLDLLSG
jgi:hypothetical protein